MIYLNSKTYYPLYGYVRSPDAVQITSEQIQEAVDDYLERNPISAQNLSVEEHIVVLKGSE